MIKQRINVSVKVLKLTNLKQDINLISNYGGDCRAQPSTETLQFHVIREGYTA